MSAAMKTEIQPECPTFKINSKQTNSMIFLIVVANGLFVLTPLGALPQNVTPVLL